uniref:(northern house mosquito) hypothetical protein n=1 Tax=Culex pipiens TaxID=7175 RepID=A0A8D8DV14_CULPI
MMTNWRARRLRKNLVTKHRFRHRRPQSGPSIRRIMVLLSWGILFHSRQYSSEVHSFEKGKPSIPTDPADRRATVVRQRRHLFPTAHPVVPHWCAVRLHPVPSHHRFLNCRRNPQWRATVLVIMVAAINQKITILTGRVNTVYPTVTLRVLVQTTKMMITAIYTA